MVLLVPLAKMDFLDAQEMMEEMEIPALKVIEEPPEHLDQLALLEWLEQKEMQDWQDSPVVTVVPEPLGRWERKETLGPQELELLVRKENLVAWEVPVCLEGKVVVVLLAKMASPDLTVSPEQKVTQERLVHPDEMVPLEGLERRVILEL